MSDPPARRTLRLLAVVGLVFSACAATEAEVDAVQESSETMSTAKLAEFRSTWSERSVSRESSGSVVFLSQAGRELLFESFWNAGDPPKYEEFVPVRKDTIYAPRSLTIPIVSAAAMTFVEEGRLDLGAPLSRYLPGLLRMEIVRFAEDGRELYTRDSLRDVRVRELLSHTSGLPSDRYVRWDKRLYPVPESVHGPRSPQPVPGRSLLPYYSCCLLAFEPGAAWELGASSDVLGTLLEHLEGRSLQKILVERIFTPLDMPGTTFFITDGMAGRVRGRIVLTTLGSANFIAIQLPFIRSEREPIFCSGSRGLYSTVEDTSHFCEMLLGLGERNGVRILSEESVRAMTTNRIGGLPRWGKPGAFGLGYGLALDPEVEGRFGWPGECRGPDAVESSFFIDRGHSLIAIQFGERSVADFRDALLASAGKTDPE